MVFTLWPRTALKIVIMAATLCSGVAVVRYDLLMGDEGPGQRDSRQNLQELEPTVHRVSVG
jgi:hypothetical protein